MIDLNVYIRDLHQRAVVVDAHCDTILNLFNKGLTLNSKDNAGKLSKMQQGNVNVQFFAIYIEERCKPFGALKRALQLLDFIYREMNNNYETLNLATSSADIANTIKAGKIAILLTIEGGEALEGDLGVLRILYRLGVRGLGLTWNQRNELADGVGEARSDGRLTHFGASVVQEMNRLGMLIDLAHLGERCFWDALDLSSAPVMVSHANCFALCQHRRNLSDTQLKALAEKGGVLGMSFVPEFVDPREPTLARLLDHIDHACALVGSEHVGLGSDFDGTEKMVQGLEDIGLLPVLTRGMYERGYPEEDILNILGGNWLRLIAQVMP